MTNKPVLLILLFTCCCHAISFDIDINVTPDSLEFLIGEQIKLWSKAAEENKKGMRELKNGNYAAAENYFNRSIEIYPEYLDPLNNLAILTLARGDTLKALEEWKGVVKMDASYSVASYNIALIYSQIEEMDSADTWCDRAYRQNPNTEAYSTLKGIIEYGRTRYHEAIIAWEYALKSDPGEASLYAYVALAYDKIGDKKKSGQFIKKGLAKQKNNTLLVLLKAKHAFEKGQFRKALEALKRGDPNNAAVQFGIGLCQFELGKFSEAEKRFTKSYSTQKDNPDIYLNLGNALLRQNKIEEAVTLLIKGRELFPDDKDIGFNLGSAHFKKKDYVKAAAVWESLEELMPDDANLYKWTGKAYFLNKQWEKAEEYFEKVLDLKSDNETKDLLAISNFRLGFVVKARALWNELRTSGGGAYSSSEIYFLKGDSKETLKKEIRLLSKYKPVSREDAFHKSVKLSRMYSLLGDYNRSIKAMIPWKYKFVSIALPLLSIYYRQSGDLENAFRCINDLGKRNTEYKRVHSMKGDLLAEMGRYSQALKELLTEPEPVALTYYQIGYCHEQLGDLKKAEAAFRKASELDPKMPAAKALLAYVVRKSDSTRSNEAQQYWKQAEELDGKNADVISNLGITYYEQKKYTEALRYARKAIELAPQKTEFRLQLGNALFKNKRYAEAVSEYRIVVLKSNRLKCSAEGNIAMVYAQQKKWKEIITEFRRSTRRCDSLNEMVGLACFHTRQLERALFYLSRVPRQRLDQNNLNGVLGEIYFQKKDYRNALKAFKASKDTTQRHYNLAQCYLALNRPGDALPEAESYRKKATKKEKYDANILVGLCHYKLKDFATAIAAFEAAHAIDRKNHRAVLNLSIAYYKQGAQKKAKGFYRKSLELNPNAWSGNRQLARLIESGTTQSAPKEGPKLKAQASDYYNSGVEFHQNGKLSVAESLYTLSVSLDSSIAGAWSNLGLVYQAMKKETKAEQSFMKAVNVDSLLPDAYFNLAALYWNNNDSLKAASWLSKGLINCPQSEILNNLRKQITGK